MSCRSTDEAAVLDSDLVRRSQLLGRDARLSLIAGALIGARDLAEGPGGDAELARSLFSVTLEALALRNAVRQELQAMGEGPR
jgi:hypothetical protein